MIRRHRTCLVALVVNVSAACAASDSSPSSSADAGTTTADDAARRPGEILARFANVLSLPSGPTTLDVWSEQRDGSWARVEASLTHTEISDYRQVPNIGPRNDQVHLRFMQQGASTEQTRDAPFVDATVTATDPGTYVVYADFAAETPSATEVPSVPKVLYVREKGMPVVGDEIGTLVQAAGVGAYGVLHSRDFRIGVKIGEARRCLEPMSAVMQGHAIAVDPVYMRFTLHGAGDTTCTTPIGVGFDRSLSPREQRLVLAWGTTPENAGVRVSNPVR